MGNRLEGRVAVVTGAGRGIGRGEALLLAEEGAKVVVNDLGGGPGGDGGDKNVADEVVDEIKSRGGQAVANYDSVATTEGAENIIKTAMDAFGRVDILVNNAGILRDRMLFNLTDEEWDIIIAVHLRGTFACSRAAARVFRQQRWGRIVSTSSESALGNMGQANYGAAKEGIVGFTRCAARDLGRYGVTVNAIRPRADTRLTMSDELKAQMERARQTASMSDSVAGGGITSLGLGDPDLIAPMVVYLCTEDAANVNGRTFLVGGDTVALYTEPSWERTIIREGGWTVDALANVFPRAIGSVIKNPSPPQEAKPS
jgi:NAD(P)-dependent dehydrogenase (short-subunit alcohol dehydrogenase family)